MALRFIVVDDSRAMQAIIRRSLAVAEFADASIIGASSGIAALDLIAAEQPDLLITDWHMPGMSGLELLQTVRQLYGPDLRVGLITTESSADLLRQAQASGSAFILHKPFDDQDLLAQVRRALNARPAARAGATAPAVAPTPEADPAVAAAVAAAVVPAVVPAAVAPEPASAAPAEPEASAPAAACPPAAADEPPPASASASASGRTIGDVLARKFGPIKFRVVENEPISIDRLSPKVLLGLLSLPGTKAAFAVALVDAATACMIGGGAQGLPPAQVRPLIASNAPDEQMTEVTTDFLREAAALLVPEGSTPPQMARGTWVSREMKKLSDALSLNAGMHGFRLQVPGYGEGRMAFILL